MYVIYVMIYWHHIRYLDEYNQTRMTERIEKCTAEHKWYVYVRTIKTNKTMIIKQESKSNIYCVWRIATHSVLTRTLSLESVLFQSVLFILLYTYLYLCKHVLNGHGISCLCQNKRALRSELSLSALLSTGWFQERIQAWFHNRTKINRCYVELIGMYPLLKIVKKTNTKQS